MNLVHQSAFLKALGWSLLDSLWQMGLLWLIYVLVTSNGKKFNSRQRHTLAIFSVGGGVLWFAINLAVRFFEGASETSLTLSSVAAQETTGRIIPVVENGLTILSVIYIFVVFTLFFRLCIEYRRTSVLARQQLQKANPELRIFIREMAQRMGIRKNVQLWLSELVDTPLTIGFWKPVVLLPVASINQLSLPQAEAVILHELNHIQQNDYLINLLIAFAEIVMFFNPFARLMTNMIRKERENSCDDMVLQFRYKPQDYAKALLLLEKNRSSTRSLALAATGRSKGLLFDRVRRILTNEQTASPVNQKMVGCLLSFGLIGFIGLFNPGNVIAEKIQHADLPASQFAWAEGTPQELRLSLPVFNESIATATAQPDQSHTPITVDEEFLTGDAVVLDEDPMHKQIALEIDEEQMTLDAYQAAIEEMNSFVNGASAREFSIVASEEATRTKPTATTSYPYVPSKSFSYHFVEDTALPKRHIITYNELQAKEALEKAMKALEEIDWLKIEKEMAAAGKKVDVIQLQKEILKAMQEVDWKKINEEVEGSLEMAQRELAEGQAKLKAQLEKHQKARVVQQEQLNKAKEMIILERLQSGDADARRPAKAPAESCKSKKKIVHI